MWVSRFRDGFLGFLVTRPDLWVHLAQAMKGEQLVGLLCESETMGWVSMFSYVKVAQVAVFQNGGLISSLVLARKKVVGLLRSNFDAVCV